MSLVADSGGSGVQRTLLEAHRMKTQGEEEAGTVPTKAKSRVGKKTTKISYQLFESVSFE
jgi:hypothetical protein